ncbi:SH3 domain-containing protein [Polycladidibacter hongkongensis]|uniref:SH3 domain-containing protein n=1 Tax=Polycladidibacter hongkongensis TaxID=1647556 RepID=UPI00082B98C5|nr:SH3 domain-containing protein [Pseudovibrio hongkongensis]
MPKLFRLKLTQLVSAVLLAGAVVLSPLQAIAQTKKIGSSGFPVPRFVSLKSDKVNVRGGPGMDHSIVWTFVKVRLPVEITQEYDNWYKIRDWEGKSGWVFKTLLTGYRSALVTPWEDAPAKTPLRRRPGPNEPIVAYLEPYVLAGVLECKDGYCRISGKDFEGWIDQERLFGVYNDEEFE